MTGGKGSDLPLLFVHNFGVFSVVLTFLRLTGISNITGGGADAISEGQKGRSQMNIVYLSPYDLTPYEQNAKVHPPEQIDHIANSILQFGWQQPIVADREKTVIIGHGRLLAAKQLHLDKVPVVFADNLTEDQANALRLADNKLNESPWDFTKLELELTALDLAGFDMEQFGFEDTHTTPEEAKEVEMNEKYQLVIDCVSEQDMQEKYEALQEVGIECRVSTL